MNTLLFGRSDQMYNNLFCQSERLKNRLANEY